MFLEPFFSGESSISVKAQQASDFAKGVANDFNPIHDVDHKRFCVPGDLLFSLVLNRYGLSQEMSFEFRSAVGDEKPMVFPESPAENFDICDPEGKVFMSVSRSGETTRDLGLIESLIRQYVSFSGTTFPHALVPLMADNDVMINPERPLVMYERMSLQLDQLDIVSPELRGSGSQLETNGKRGTATLSFDIVDGERIVGRGNKILLLSGLRAYDADALKGVIDLYEQRKQAYMGL